MGSRSLRVLILSALLLSGTAHAPVALALQGIPYDPNPILDLMPALRTAPAPAWLKQGLRITYYSAAASVLGGRHRYNAHSGILILSNNSTKGPPIQGPVLPTDSRAGMTY